ncbi:MAG: acyl carrier protein [Acidimicrobiales bacterium]
MASIEYERISAVIVEALELVDVHLDRDTSFEDAGLDSISVYEALIVVEEAFGVFPELGPGPVTLRSIWQATNAGLTGVERRDSDGLD